MSRRPYTIALIVLLVAIISAVGYMYIKERPQVTDDKTKDMLEGYKTDLEGAYAELNDTYSRLAVEKNLEEWQSFSADWMPKLSNVRPADIDKRLPSDYEGKKNVLVSIHGALLSLWNEYNKDFTGDVSDVQRVNELKTGIEDVFKSLQI